MLTDFRTAPIRAQMMATLAFLEKLTVSPESVTANDARMVLAAGVSARELARAVYIATMMNVVNRLSRTLDFDIPSAETMARRAKVSVDRLRREGKII